MKTKTQRQTAKIIFPMGVFAVTAYIDYDTKEESYDWQDDSYEPPETVLKNVSVSKVDNGEVTVTFNQRPDWFKWLNRIVRPFVEDNLVRLVEERGTYL